MTLHRVLNLTLADLNRTLELIQRQTSNQIQNPTTGNTPSGGGGSSATAVVVGPQGPQGPAGADGVMDLDRLVTSRTEDVSLITTRSGSIVNDSKGWAITSIHTEWELVTDSCGNIITTG